jgi:hypothetical protein
MKLPDSIRSFQPNLLHLELLFENGRLSAFRLSLGLPVVFGIVIIELLRVFSK